MAGTLQIQFNILPAILGFNFGPQPDGANGPDGLPVRFQTTALHSTGSLVLRIDGVDGNGALLGSAANVSLMGLGLSAAALTSIDGEFPPMTFARLERDTLTQSGIARGVFDGSRIVFAAGQIAGQNASEIQCGGTFCLLASFIDSGSRVTPFSNAAPFALALSFNGQTASLDAETVFPFGTGSGPVGSPLLQLNGFELSRTFVPEPSELGLLAMILLAFAGPGLRVSRPVSRRSLRRGHIFRRPAGWPLRF